MNNVTIAGHGFRGNFKVSNVNEPLYTILEGFCKKNKLNPDHFELIPDGKKKPIDLSLSWRLSSLTNHCLLELRKKSGIMENSKENVTQKKKTRRKCKVAIQTHDGERHVLEVPLSYTLFEVLFLIEFKNEVNLVFNEKKGMYMQPKLVFLNHEYDTVESLSKRTLRKLGIKRKQSAMFRLSLKETTMNMNDIRPILDGFKESFIKEYLSEQEMRNIHQLENEKAVKENEEKKAKQMKDEEKEDEGENEEEPKIKRPQKEEDNHHHLKGENDENDLSLLREHVLLIPVPKEIKAKDVQLFEFGSGETPTFTDIDESVFEMRPHEMKILIAQNAKEEGFRTQKIRDLEAKKKERKYKECLIRIRFPDGLLLQGSFSPKQTLKEVRKLVNFVLEKENEKEEKNFYFFQAPPVREFTKEEEKEKTLEDLKLVPASMINISSKKKDEIIRIQKMFVQKFRQELKEGIIPQNENEKNTIRNKKKNNNVSGKKRKLENSESSQKKKQKIVPKWFKKKF